MSKSLFIFIFFLPHSLVASSFEKEINSAHKWLKNQVIPNQAVKNPYKHKKNLVLSYQPKKSHPKYKYLYSKATLYDNALSVIAFTMLKDYQTAEKILLSIEKDYQDSGKLWFNYSTHNYWPNKEDHDGAIERNGANAWFGYALTFYLKAQVKINPLFLKTEKGKGLLIFLETLTNNIIKDQVKDPKDKRFGFIKGGQGTYKITTDKITNEPRETFSPGPVEWCSIEHNIDSYYFLRDSFSITGTLSTKEAYKTLERSLLKNAWNPRLKQFNRGQTIEGADETEALDAASWGAMFLYSTDQNKKAQVALTKTSRYLGERKIGYGHKPYLNMLVYEDPAPNKIFYPNNPSKNWNEIKINWYEGTFGVILAQLKGKNVEQARRNLTSVAKAQLANGSFLYADEEIPFQFAKAPSVASTAWFLICALSINDSEVNNSFWGK